MRKTPAQGRWLLRLDDCSKMDWSGISGDHDLWRPWKLEKVDTFRDDDIFHTNEAITSSIPRNHSRNHFLNFKLSFTNLYIISYQAGNNPLQLFSSLDPTKKGKLTAKLPAHPIHHPWRCLLHLADGSCTQDMGECYLFGWSITTKQTGRRQVQSLANRCRCQPFWKKSRLDPPKRESTLTLSLNKKNTLSP